MNIKSKFTEENPQYILSGGEEALYAPDGIARKMGKRWTVTSKIKHPSVIFEDGVSYTLEIGQQADNLFYILEDKIIFHGREYKTLKKAFIAASEILSIKDAIDTKNDFPVILWDKINSRHDMGWRNIPKGYVLNGNKYVYTNQ